MRWIKLFLPLVFLGALNTAAKGEPILLLAHADKTAAKYGVPAHVLKAICQVESNWNPGTGKHGELGVCQVKPATAKMLCPQCNYGKLVDDLKNPHKNIEWAARYLGWLYEQFNDDDLVIAAYNGGPNNAIVRYLIKVKLAIKDYDNSGTLRTSENK